MLHSIMAVQDEIAKYFVHLADEPSHWYCINGSYNDVSHLSQRFGMSINNYQALLVAANLANFVDGKFTILRKQWNNFVTTSSFRRSKVAVQAHSMHKEQPT